ncbi:kinectin-like [Helianthus annuus]|uniref:kinectin-like n=1 Tax=Helianthus annuus TaxID=4232 RepID=UPI000B902AE9|nr:kinectin-like [Helianthus annuus]
MSWKKKAEAEATLLSEERKRWREICEKDNSEKIVLRNNVNNLKTEIEKLKKEKTEAEAARDEARSHRERSEQREEQTKAELESAKKDLQLVRVENAEAMRRLTETEEKLENSKTARVTAESLVEPLNNNILWMQHHGIINVANSILNSIDLDQIVANLMVTARHDSYA